jgi:hypothetical protein
MNRIKFSNNIVNVLIYSVKVNFKLFNDVNYLTTSIIKQCGLNRNNDLNNIR